MLVVGLLFSAILVGLLVRAVKNSRYVHEKDEPPEDLPGTRRGRKTDSRTFEHGFDQLEFSSYAGESQTSLHRVGVSIQTHISRKIGSTRWLHSVPVFSGLSSSPHQYQHDATQTV